MLRHPSSAVAHQLRQGLDVHAVEDRARAEGVAQSVQLGIVSHAGGPTYSADTVAQVAPVPRRLPVSQKNMRPRFAPPLDVAEQLDDYRVERYDAGLLRSFASLVLTEHDHRV